jgi:hypothetical protein
MTLLHKQDMQGRLDKILDDLRYVLIDQLMYKDNGLDTVYIKRDDKTIKKAKTALTHLIEDYVVAELEKILDHPEYGRHLPMGVIEDRLQQLNSKEIK